MSLLFSRDQTPDTDGLVVLCPPDTYADPSQPLTGPLRDYDDALDGHLGRLIRQRSLPSLIARAAKVPWESST